MEWEEALGVCTGEDTKTVASSDYKGGDEVSEGGVGVGDGEDT